MKKDRAVQVLERQKQLSNLVVRDGARSVSDPKFRKWQRDTEVAIRKVFGEGSSHLAEFKTIRYSLNVLFSGTPDSEFDRAFLSGMDEAEALLASMIDELREYQDEEDDEVAKELSSSKLIEILCNRFHSVVHQLRRRHDNRETLDVDDEYDVQDLLHALLKIHFDDVRAEEWTPSYAGKASRMDFLLKDEQIVIEVKKTRKSMTEGNLGEQLIVDRARYEAHPNCKLLVCFIYDPDGRIVNPVGIERDLEATKSNLDVRVIIAPKL